MPAENVLNSATDYDDLDVTSVAEEIGASLFPGEKKAANEGEDDADNFALNEPKEKPAAEKPPVTPAAESKTETGEIVPGQNSVSMPLPKSWKKDMAPHWEKLPPEVHKYVYAREADVMRGIQQYQQAAQTWQALVQPYAQLLQANPEVQPVELMQSLMNTHLQLLNPRVPAEQKAQMARAILRDYGIDLSAEAGQPQSELLAELNNVKAELYQLKSGFTNQQKAQYQAGVSAKEAEVAAFAADPKNKYFDEVGNDILRFIAQGVANDLPSAYEMACWANPAVRAKLVAEQQAAQTPAGKNPRDKAGKFVNLEGDTPPPRTRRGGSIDSTIDAIVAAHYSPSKH